MLSSKLSDGRFLPMKARFTSIFLLFILTCCCTALLNAQVTLRGTVSDDTGETLIGASVVVVGTTTGNTTDFDGNFELTVPSVPTKLVISYVGYSSDTLQVESGADPINVILGDNATTMVTVEVKGRRISEKRQQSALTMETLDNIAIKETPAANFYDGLGSLKDVDLTAASIGFKIVNTRGFNSTNPVRSLQIIDGVDNQSPGLNFSLGNFLGASDLDVNSVNIIVGASSAFYGPNAFNGVISMQTKDPFLQQGLSATVKAGERQLVEGGFRWAQAAKNKDGKEWFAYKLNVYGFQANDWVADNYDPITETTVPASNPGGYDAVNEYGDEFQRNYDRTGRVPGLGNFYRRGYREEDLVNYDSENLKLGGAFHFRLKPELDLMSPEIVATTSYSRGTTIYQGDNRFSLQGIQFYQHKLELRKRNTYFFRTYYTHEDAGDSFDPYFTALILSDSAKSVTDFAQRYEQFWTNGVRNEAGILEGNYDNFFTDMDNYPSIIDFPGDPDGFRDARIEFESMFQDSLVQFHRRAQQYANLGNPNDENVLAFFEPGTARFQELFDKVTTTLSNEENGTRFFDRSALLHSHGEYLFNDLVEGEKMTDLDLRAGANFRLYTPNSQGTILQDTNGRNIDTYEYGIYGGGTATFDEKWKVSSSLRLDKNQNFDFLVSPAASVVYNPNETTTLRLSFSSAIRNPTLADQYLNYNVGPATLLGNLSGFDSLATIDGLIDYQNDGMGDASLLGYFNVDAIRPEKVQTVEAGVRTTLFEKIFLDATYYYSQYQDFIGFVLGADLEFTPNTFRVAGADVYRISANASQQVTTQGFSIGTNYYFGEYFAASGNYSWNVLTTQVDDPIIPAFNTPEHKFNAGLAARDIPITLFGDSQSLGFNGNYKWVDGFIFEGSPQFTGFIPAYGMLDFQINMVVPKINSTIKIGASNLLDNQVFQTYGGPRVGRLAYASFTYEFKKR